MNHVTEQAIPRTSGAVARPQGGADIVATVVASIAIALPLVFYLHQHVEILRLGYEIESLKERRVAIAERSRELRVERTRAASLPRVEEQAALMGLAAPAPSDIYVAASPNSECIEPDAFAMNDGSQSVMAKLE